jgi:phage-related baseplate assembly protein
METLDFEAIFAARKARFLYLCPPDQRAEIAATLGLESEPVVITLQELAYCELLLRARVNEAARQCHLAAAAGSNLDHLAAFFGVQRLLSDPGDSAAIPPIPPAWESDTRLRYRTQLAVEGMSTAGPIESYRFHALSAHGGVDDASVISPVPGQVVVTILAKDGDGTPSQDVLDAVTAHLNAKTIRPLTDEVIVQAASIVPYAIGAKLTLYPGPAPTPILDAVQRAVENYTHATNRLGYDVTLSGLFAALHQNGVQKVMLFAPADGIHIDDTQAARCTGIAIEVVGTDT